MVRVMWGFCCTLLTIVLGVCMSPLDIQDTETEVSLVFDWYVFWGSSHTEPEFRCDWAQINKNSLFAYKPLTTVFVCLVFFSIKC